ncbi:MAG TPA: ABC transporter substrate-binding protein [Firmicutes bacterium]|nr:ABC transporter substrate-binding protein [Bacillota bacterium]
MINRKTRLLAIVTITVLCLTLISGCQQSSAPGLEEVTVLLDWTPNTNYSGLYAAKDMGYYREEGLEVEIVQAPGSVPQLLSAGKGKFGVSYQEEVTFARLENIPIVSIAAVVQHNSSGFASLIETGINTPADFEGKKYGGWGSPVEEATIKALAERFGADFNKVEIITAGEADFFTIIERLADFAWIYYGWNGVEAELKGLELNFIKLRDLDPALDYYTPVLITSETVINERPDLAKKFMRATARGYRLAIDNPEKAAEILLNNAPELDRELVMASQQWLAGKLQDDAEKWGWQEKNTWESYTKWLYDNRLIQEMPELDRAFTNEFIP